METTDGREIPGIGDPRQPELTPVASALGQCRANETTPRAAALADLYAHAAALSSGGDLVAARALHETIGKLLGLDDPPGAKVIDLVRSRPLRS